MGVLLGQRALTIGAWIGDAAGSQPTGANLRAEHRRAGHFRRLRMHNLPEIVPCLKPVTGPAHRGAQEVRVETHVGILRGAHRGHDALHGGVAARRLDRGGEERAVVRLHRLILGQAKFDDTK